MPNKQTLLELALRRIAEGDIPREVVSHWRADGKASKLDQCGHGYNMLEDCGECIAEFAQTVLVSYYG